MIHRRAKILPDIGTEQSFQILNQLKYFIFDITYTV